MTRLSGEERVGVAFVPLHLKTHREPPRFGGLALRAGTPPRRGTAPSPFEATAI